MDWRVDAAEIACGDFACAPRNDGKLMTAPFEHHTDVGWFDLDANGHMKNVAYMERSVDCRLRFFAANGFPPAEFVRLNVAFVVVTDTTTYSRELFLGDKIRVQILCGGANARGSRFLIVNRILSADGALVYEIRSMLVWLDTRTRKSCTPPQGLLNVIAGMARTEDYRDL
jgi:acyl-CoA thioester hydrolase